MRWSHLRMQRHIQLGASGRRQVGCYGGRRDQRQERQRQRRAEAHRGGEESTLTDGAPLQTFEIRFKKP